MHLIPKSDNAQTACSRDDPEPKLRRVAIIEQPEYDGEFRIKSGLGTPWFLYLQL